jgi:hypothetical protein
MGFGDILRNASKMSYLPEMTRKAFTRLHYGFNETEAATSWARERALPLSDWASKRDPKVWAESQEICRQIRLEADLLLSPLHAQGIDLGGGGSIDLLYFLVRSKRPTVVLETGVAAGWSSLAILRALEKNGVGELRSSDFPYFRMSDPERFVGLLVPESLKHRWTLETRGDRRNLPELLKGVDSIDLIHYDSDKSRPGREWFARQIRPLLRPGSIVIWDDVVDNLAFRDRADRIEETYVLDTPNGLVGLEVTT